MIESAAHIEGAVIKAVIDGVVCYIPDDMANSDRLKLAAWEAEGNTIAPYVVPLPPTALELGTQDTATIAAAFTNSVGSVERALARMIFKIIKGTIVVPQPALTQAQFLALVKAEIR